MTPPRPVRIFLVDDHAVVRQGLATLLAGEPGFEIVGEAGTVASALNRIPAARPHVVLLDVRLPDGDGAEVCRAVRERLRDTRCIMLTSHDDEHALFESVMAGADGYLLKSVRSTNLVEAVLQVASGQSLIDPAVTGRLLARLREGARQDERFAILTAREREILRYIAQGLSNREIAERLFLAEKTVKNNVTALLAKLGVARRSQAALLAAELRRT